MEDDVSNYINAGADFVVTKPLRIGMVNSVLNHARANGTRSLRDMKLAEVDGKVCWVKR